MSPEASFPSQRTQGESPPSARGKDGVEDLDRSPSVNDDVSGCTQRASELENQRRLHIQEAWTLRHRYEQLKHARKALKAGQGEEGRTDSEERSKELELLGTSARKLENDDVTLNGEYQKEMNAALDRRPSAPRSHKSAEAQLAHQLASRQVQKGTWIAHRSLLSTLLGPLTKLPEQQSLEECWVSICKLSGDYIELARSEEELGYRKTELDYFDAPRPDDQARDSQDLQGRTTTGFNLDSEDSPIADGRFQMTVQHSLDHTREIPQVPGAEEVQQVLRKPLRDANDSVDEILKGSKLPMRYRELCGALKELHGSIASAHAKALESLENTVQTICREKPDCPGAAHERLMDLARDAYKWKRLEEQEILSQQIPQMLQRRWEAEKVLAKTLSRTLGEDPGLDQRAREVLTWRDNVVHDALRPERWVENLSGSLPDEYRSGFQRVLSAHEHTRTTIATDLSRSLYKLGKRLTDAGHERNLVYAPTEDLVQALKKERLAKKEARKAKKARRARRALERSGKATPVTPASQAATADTELSSPASTLVDIAGPTKEWTADKDLPVIQSGAMSPADVVAVPEAQPHQPFDVQLTTEPPAGCQEVRTAVQSPSGPLSAPQSVSSLKVEPHTGGLSRTCMEIVPGQSHSDDPQHKGSIGHIPPLKQQSDPKIHPSKWEVFATPVPENPGTDTDGSDTESAPKGSDGNTAPSSICGSHDRSPGLVPITPDRSGPEGLVVFPRGKTCGSQIPYGFAGHLGSFECYPKYYHSAGSGKVPLEAPTLPRPSEGTMSTPAVDDQAFHWQLTPRGTSSGQSSMRPCARSGGAKKPMEGSVHFPKRGRWGPTLEKWIEPGPPSEDPVTASAKNAYTQRFYHRPENASIAVPSSPSDAYPNLYLSTPPGRAAPSHENWHLELNSQPPYPLTHIYVPSPWPNSQQHFHEAHEQHPPYQHPYPHQSQQDLDHQHPPQSFSQGQGQTRPTQPTFSNQDFLHLPLQQQRSHPTYPPQFQLPFPHTGSLHPSPHSPHPQTPFEIFPHPQLPPNPPFHSWLELPPSHPRSCPQSSSIPASADRLSIYHLHQSPPYQESFGPSPSLQRCPSDLAILQPLPPEYRSPHDNSVATLPSSGSTLSAQPTPTSHATRPPSPLTPGLGDSDPTDEGMRGKERLYHYDASMGGVWTLANTLQQLSPLPRRRDSTGSIPAIGLTLGPRGW
jgi:hypothetical protein